MTHPDGQGLWVYAIAGSLDPARLEALAGLDGRPVRSLQAAGLAAVVTPVSLAEFGEQPLRHHLERLPWVEATARHHHRVIETVAGHTPVIPVRLATVSHDEPAVARLLADRSEDLTAVLARIAGHTEWGIKAYAPRPEPDRTDGGTPPRSGAPPTGAGAAYLHRRRAELTTARDAGRAAARGARAVHTTLQAVASASELRALHPGQLHEPGRRHARMVLNAAYLVPDEQTDRFEAVRQVLVDDHPDLAIERTGPWPPYSFATLATDEGRPRTTPAATGDPTG
jgi:Gas vesicle synthesis protein GvpL/GvpF